MVCDGCGAENREDASFCADCGSPLARRCPHCAREVTATARFCDGCGTTLATSAPAAPAAVRKTVTAMFCDLGGSTGFGERVDAETARAVIGRYHALLQEVVDAHAGTVAKFIGDGMLAFFGIPEVAEDDAERAVAAAAGMQRRFAAFADEVEAAHGERLTFRVGVNSGEVVIGDGDADVVGDALNVAARLEKACAPGRVLVGEATWRLTRSRFGYEPLGEVEVTGRAEPVAAYVLAEDERPTDEATPFVGRDDELARLRAALDDAVAARTARFVTVIGPPGVGKTRLSRELEQSVEDGARVLHTACERAGGSTFGPLVDLIRPALGGEATRESLAAIVPAAEPERDRVIDGLAGIVGLGEARSTEETFWALRRLVESLAADQPLVLVIDDIQWAEARLLDLLEHLAEWVADAPVLLVGLARPELREVRPALAEPSRRVADVLVLDGLDPAATARLAGEMLGGNGLPPELVARLPESTDGNPLFVRELVRMLVDEGVIRRDGDDWRLTVDADAVEVPPTIRSLLAARIERLPVVERTVLERASVVGPDFALGAVRTLMEGDGALDGHLEGLRRRDLLEPTGTYWGEEPVWRFHHVLIRDAVYGRLLKGDRADLHERVGDWTAGAAPHVVGEHETAIAHHYEQAHGYRSQLGALDDHGRELGRRAAGLLAIAARRSLVQDDLVAASSLATRALACLDDEAGERGDLLLLAAEAVLASGDLAQAPTVLDGLAALGATDPRAAAWADVYRAQWLDLTDPTRLDEVERLADHATERFVDAGDGSGQAKAHLVRASVLARRGRLADSEVELDRAMGAAREAKDRRRLVAALGAAPAVALWGPSPVARAGGRCLDVIRLLRITTQSPVVEATSLRHQAVLEALRGRFGPARTLLTDVRTTVEDLGLRRDLMEVELFEGVVDLLEGDAAAAEGHLRTAHEGLAALGAAAAGGAAALLARALLAQGRVDDAAALADEVGATSGQDLKAAIAWGSVTAEIRAARGDATEAVAAAEEAVALAEGTDLVLDHADALASLARVRRTTGDLAGAETAEAEARRRYEAKGSTVHPGETAAPPAGSSRTEPEVWHLEVGRRNLAVRRHLELLIRWQTEGPEAAGELYGPGVRFVDRRAGFDSEVVGRAAMVDQLREVDDLVGAKSFRLHGVVAERGEHLALVRQGIEGDYEVELLCLVEVDDGGAEIAYTFFDVDDLPLALAELDTRHEALTPENLAARVTRELTDRWLAEGPDAVIDRYVPDCRLVDRRRGLGSELVGREGLKAQLQAILDLIGDDGRLVLREVLAERGEHLALLRQGVDADGYEVEMLSLVEVDDEGRQVASTLFDIDQQSEAMAELDARYRALTPENLAVRVVRETTARWLAEGPDAVLDLFAPDCRLVDRRVGFNSEVVGRAALVEQLRAVGDLVGAQSFRLHAVVAERGERLALFRQGVGGEYEVEILCLVEVDADGRQITSTFLDVDDLESAMAELDRRHAELSTGGTALAENLAARTHRGFSERFLVEGMAEDRDRYLPDAEMVDHRRGLEAHLVGREVVLAHIGTMRGLLDGQSVELHLEVVAQRGDHLAVVRQQMLGDIDVEVLTLIEVDHAGRYRQIDHFDPDDLAVALAALDRRHADLAGNRAARLNVALIERWVEDGADAAIDLIAEDIHVEDRRRGLQAATDGREAHLANLQGTDGLWGESRFATPELLACRGEHLVLSRQLIVGDAEVEMLTVTAFDVADRMCRLIIFDPGDLASAVAELDRGHAERSNLGPTPAGNRASRRNAVLVDRWMAEGVDAVADVIAEDLHVEDRRTGLGSVLDGREAHLANLRAVDELRGSSRFVNRDVVAIRGERLVLSRQAIEGEAEIEMLGLLELDTEDRVCLAILFDPDDLAGALAELEQRYAAGEGSVFAEEILVSAAFGQAVAAGATEALGELLADDFVCEDHRAIGWGERDRATFLAAVGARPDTLGAGVGVSASVHLRRGLVLAPYEIWTRTATGADLQEVGVSVTQIRGGEVTRLELFGEHDRAAAEARVDELSSATLPGPPVVAHEVENAAARQAREFVRRWVVEGADSIRPLFSAEIRNIDHRSGLTHVVEGIDEFVENLRATSDLLGQDEYRLFEVVAERGDRLALLEQGVHGAVEVRLLIVNEVDAAGRSIQADTFDGDDLEAALDELDRRYAVGEGRAFATEISNAAAAGRAIAAGDADALAEMITDDFVFVDHRLVGWGEPDRGTLLAAVAARPDTLGRGLWIGRQIRPRPGAVLTTYEIRTDADIVEVGVSVATLRGDRGDRLEVFAEDDRPAAEARFDELTGSGSGAGSEPLVVRRFRQHFSLLTAGEVEAAEALVARNNVTEDRRRGMREVTIGREARLVAARALREALGGATFGIGEVVDHRGEHLALVRLDTVGGFGPTVQSHAVIECDADGLVTGLVVFDLGALDEARAELDRRVPANPAETFGKVFNERWIAEGADAVAELIADDVVFEDHRVGLRASWRGRAALLDNLRVIDELTTADARVVTTDPIAHRGERLSLHTYDFPLMGVETLNVSEFDEDGRLVFTTFFEHDALVGAAQELDRRYAEAEGKAFATEITVTAVGGQAIASGDADAFAAMITDDFVFVDHRLVGWGEPDRATFLAAVAARPDSLGRGVWIGRELRPRSGVVLTTYEIRTDADIVEVGVSVATMRGDRCNRLEVFAEDDRAAAEARFEELSVPEPEENTAAGRARELARRWMADGVDAVQHLVADECRLVDHRLGLGSDVIGAEAYLAGLRVVDELRGEDGLQVLAVIAQRGERLVLTEQGLAGQVDVRMLSVLEFDEIGHLVASDIYDTGDLGSAVDQLDRRYVEGEGAPFAGEVAVCAAAWKALAAGDAEAVDPLLADDFVLVDHLPLRGWLGEIDRTGYLRSITGRAADLGVGVGFPRRYLRLAPGVVLVDYELTLRRAVDGFESTESGLAVAAIRGGQLIRAEVFAEEDRERAEARFEELSAPAGPVENLAARGYREFVRLWMSEGAEAVRSVLAEGYRFVDHRLAMGSAIEGIDAIVANLRNIDELLEGEEFRVFSVPAERGERLALIDRGVDSERATVRDLSVVGVDEAGRVLSVDLYDTDDLEAAVDELDRRFAAGEGAAHADVLGLCVAFVRALGTGDTEALDVLLTEDFVLVDHLPLRDGFGEISRAQWLFIMADRPAVVGRGLGFIPRYLRFEPGLILSSYELRSRTSAGFESTEAGLAVSVIRDGRIARTESFAVEDRDAAEACFAELSAPGPEIAIANAATRAMAPYPERFARRDWAWVREFCDEHHRNDDRRSGVNSGVSVGRDRLLELTEALADSGFATMHQVPVAVRGEALALYRRTWGHEDGFELTLLALVEVDAAGHFVANTMWELGDRVLALDELDRRHRALEGAAYPTVLGAMHAFSQAFARRDWDAIPELVSPSLRAVDHRPMGHGEIGFAERFERDRALAEAMPDALTYVAAARCSGRVGLLRGGWSSVGPDSPGFESVSLLVLVVDDTGRMERLEFFAEDDAARAHECFEGLVAVHG